MSYISDLELTQEIQDLEPVFSRDFAANPVLNPEIAGEITFTRSTAAWHINELGLVAESAVDAPRFDYDPTTKACKGLLIEESRANLLTYSEDFTTAEWASVSNRALRIASTGIDDPAGGTTAATYKNNNSVGNDLVSRIITATPGTTYTYSVWLRRRTGVGPVNMVVGDLGNNFAVAVTNQWARFSVSGLASTTTGRAYVLIYGVNDEIDIWGASLEVGSFPTSYIRTTTAAVTRAADVCLVTGTNFSKWWNPSEFTIVVRSNGQKTVGGPVGLAPTGAAIVALNGSSVVSDLFGTLVQAFGSLNSYGNTITTARAVKFSTGDSVLVNQGTIAIQAAPITPISPAETGLTIGYRGNGSFILCGYVELVRVYPKRLSNRLLKAITLP